MKKILNLIILAGLFAVPAFAQHPPQDKNWKVVFQDDFSSLNTSRWWVRDNFDNDGRYPIYLKENVYIDSGKLVFETKEEDPCYHCHPPQHVGPYGCKREYEYKELGIEWCYPHSCGWIESRENYPYGYFEIYAKLPGGPGFYPAFWFHSNGKNPVTNECWYNEIDVFEIYPCWQNSIDTAPHWGFICGERAKAAYTQAACNFPYIWHWYGLEWDRDKITWYIDRKIVRQVTNNMEGKGVQNPMRIIINSGLHAPDDRCPVTDDSIFPNYMYMEQANVYQLNCDDCGTPVTEIANFNTFAYGVKKSITMSGATTIPTGSNITLRVTDYIELQPGFTVDTGRELYLDVNPCNNGIGIGIGIGVEHQGGVDP